MAEDGGGDDTDLPHLAQRLRLGPRELARAIGGPWHVARRDERQEPLSPGTLFVGRAGPSVGLVIADDPDPEVIVGSVTGHWSGPTDLRWHLEADVVLRTPARDASTVEVDSFRDALGVAVDALAAASAVHLVTCRYCGTLVAPALTVGEEMCGPCGAGIFGIRY